MRGSNTFEARNGCGSTISGQILWTDMAQVKTVTMRHLRTPPRSYFSPPWVSQERLMPLCRGSFCRQDKKYRFFYCNRYYPWYSANVAGGFVQRGATCACDARRRCLDAVCTTKCRRCSEYQAIELIELIVNNPGDTPLEKQADGRTMVANSCETMEPKSFHNSGAN